MAEIIPLESLTKKQIEEHILKRENIKKGPLGLEILFEEFSNLRPYIQIIDRKETHSFISGDKITPRLKVHLNYYLNPLDIKLINGIFENSKEIKIVFSSLHGRSTYAVKEIQTLEDTNKILDLAEQYHRVKVSKNYKEAIMIHDVAIKNLSNNLTDIFSQNLFKNF